MERTSGKSTTFLLFLPALEKNLELENYLIRNTNYKMLNKNFKSEAWRLFLETGATCCRR